MNHNAAIVAQLKRIADALEKQIDLTAEDAAVKKAMGDVIRAEHNIPPRVSPPRPQTKGTT